MTINIIKAIFLFFAVLYTSTFVVKAVRRHKISALNTILMTIGIVGFIYYMFWNQ